MAWDTGSLSHALCASPVDPLFMKTLLKHNIKSDGVQFWTDSRIGESQKVGFELCLSVCLTISLVNSHSDAHAIKAQKTINVIKSAASMQGHKKLSMDACMHAAQNERLRLRVVVQVLFSDHVKISKAIASSTVKETGESHDKATKAVLASEQLSMHEIYIARAAKIYGLPETLEIYEHAISSEGHPEKDAMKICIKYAEFGKSHGETDHMLYEFNIMSTSLPDINHPNLAPEYQSQSTLLSFDVPACPRSSRLKGLTVTFRYTISDDDWDALGEHHLTLEQEIVAFVLQAFFSRPKKLFDYTNRASFGYPSPASVTLSFPVLSCEQLDKAQTADPFWNAFRLKIVHYGKMHGGGVAIEQKNRNDKKHDINNISPQADTMTTDWNNVLATIENKDAYQPPDCLKKLEGRTHVFQFHFDTGTTSRRSLNPTTPTHTLVPQSTDQPSGSITKLIQQLLTPPEQQYAFVEKENTKEKLQKIDTQSFDSRNDKYRR
ncbi:RNA-processing protein, HAT helix containing protein [Tanacetum coccineum]